MRNSTSLIFLTMLVVLLSGCASPWFSKKKSEVITADANNPVVRAICLWQPAEGPGLDGLPTRGFAGQIIFLTQQSPTPVKVNDDLRIYLFDDQGSAEDQAKPIHQFEFMGGACNRYLQITSWGPSYQLFIPYVRRGDQEARCSLRVALKSDDQPVVFSDMVDVLLPGKTSEQMNVGGESLDGANRLLDFAAIKSSLPTGRTNAGTSTQTSFEWNQATTSAMNQSENSASASSVANPGMKTYSIPFDDTMINR